MPPGAFTPILYTNLAMVVRENTGSLTKTHFENFKVNTGGRFFSREVEWNHAVLVYPHLILVALFSRYI